MAQDKMTREEEYEFYASPENRAPQGPARRRQRSKLTEMVPVRFPAETLDQVWRLTEANDRSVSIGSAERSTASSACKSADGRVLFELPLVGTTAKG